MRLHTNVCQCLIEVDLSCGPFAASHSWLALTIDHVLGAGVSLVVVLFSSRSVAVTPGSNLASQDADTLLAWMWYS